MNRLATLWVLPICAGLLNAQVDTIPPLLKCRQNTQITISIPCFRITNTYEFIDSLADNSPGPIQLGIRKACTGIGFPQDTFVFITSSEWGLMKLEIWAKDAAGNTASCIVPALVYDVSGSCDPGISLSVWTPENKGVAGVRINISGENCLGDTLQVSSWPMITMPGGYWSAFGALNNAGYTTRVVPSKTSNPVNGVTTFDLSEIQKHILGTKLFDSPYKILAADANQDGKVSLQDVVLLQKLLLGITTELPHGKSWRFVPADYKFPDPANPFSAPEPIIVPQITDQAYSSFSFIGVKIGDLNYSADPDQ